MIFKKIFLPIFIGLFILNSCVKSKADLPPNELFYDFIAKADTFNYNQKYDSAYHYYLKAKQTCNVDEKERVVYALYKIAYIQQKRCDFAESEATATEIIKTYPEYEHIYSTYNLLGLSYLEQYNFDSALKYFNRAIKSNATEKNKLVYRNNIGYTYLEAKEFRNAQQILSKALVHDSLASNPVSNADVLDNLGYAYFKLNNPKAINYLNKSLQIRDSLKDHSELIASYIHLSEYYLNSNPNLALDFAQKAYNSATEINSPDDRIEAIKFQIASSNSNDVKVLALKQMSISDSINKIRQASKTKFANIKYDFSIAQKESEKHKTQKQLYLILFLFATTIFLLIFFTIRSRNRRKLKIISYETETRISKRLHDELANDVFNILTYVETQDLQNSTKKEHLLENLDAIYTRTRNIARENSDIDTGNKYAENLQSMIASYIATDVNVLIQNTNTINWISLKKEVKIAIYRTLQELLVNMKKHSQCSVAVIRFESDKKDITINYSDNGIGTSKILKFKNGLQNAENRIFAVKGTITFETEAGKGFKAQIIVPQ